MPQECSQIHHIFDDMIKNCQFFNEIAKDVISFTWDSAVVCHNASFDLLFVRKELYQVGISAKNICYIDTLNLARQYFSFESNKLGDIANATGVDMWNLAIER
ncbi:MAG: 3'-5' exonuclease [Endomicrobium sp.]|nr:3'-5' exonuclease [Endomicrobium sp.]